MTTNTRPQFDRKKEWRVFRSSRLIELTLVLIMVTFCLGEDQLRDCLWLIYGTQGICLINLVFLVKDRWLFLLSPSFLTATFLSMNSTVGALAFGADVVYHDIDYFYYLDWLHLHWTVAFFLLSVVVVVAPFFLVQRSNFPLSFGDAKDRSVKAVPISEFVLVAAFSALVFLFFSLVDVNASALGVDGSLGLFPKTLAAIALVVALSRTKMKGRFLFYFGILLLFATFSSSSKRQAIFLALPILLVECQNWAQPRIQLKWLISGVLASAFISLLIVMMSIYRGYGQYEPESFLDSRHYVVDYLKSPAAYEYLLNNFEINYTFYHSHQALEYYFDDPDILLYGVTFAKVLFIPIPRSVLPSKPEGIIHHYTFRHNPAHRERGGSWVSTLLAEFFWNFGYLGFVALFAFFALVSSLYLKFVRSLRSGLTYKHVFGLFAFQQVMVLIRGSGFDLFVVQLLLGGFFYFVLFLPVLIFIQSLHKGSSRKAVVKPLQMV